MLAAKAQSRPPAALHLGPSRERREPVPTRLPIAVSRQTVNGSDQCLSLPYGVHSLRTRGRDGRAW